MELFWGEDFAGAGVAGGLEGGHERFVGVDFVGYCIRIIKPYSILRQIANLPQQVATENILRDGNLSIFPWPSGASNRLISINYTHIK